MLECVVNISEGRRSAVIRAIAGAAGNDLLDVHRDGDHHRCVLTLVGEDAPMAVAAEAVAGLDLRTHCGAHPRIGVVDVVPFAPLQGSTMDDALAARRRFAERLWRELGVPSFLYGPERSLPYVRRHAFGSLLPDVGGPGPHRSAGAAAVGARPVLVAYNLWLVQADVGLARRLAAELRGPAVRALGLALGERAQVSMNLVDPHSVGPLEVYEQVSARAEIATAELVGLVPRSVLDVVPAGRWEQLDLGPDRTIEGRLAALG